MDFKLQVGITDCSPNEKYTDCILTFLDKKYGTSVENFTAKENYKTHLKLTSYEYILDETGCQKPCSWPK